MNDDIQTRAVAGDAAAMTEMALASIAEGDSGTAARWFEKAADAGHAPGLAGLGLLRAVAGDPAAFNTLQRALEQGERAAHAGLAVCYAEGVGVEADPVQAVAHIWEAEAAAPRFATMMAGAEATLLRGLGPADRERARRMAGA